MTCPNCKCTFRPQFVASTATLDQLSPLGISISGGGHRATLFGLGALLALVDLGLNRRVVQISSVSGGSVLNGFVALRCAFEQQHAESFDPIAHELATVIVNKGVLTQAWIRTIALFPVAVYLLALATRRHAPLPESIFLVIVAGFCLGAFLFRGWAVEWLLHRRLLSTSRRWVRIGELPERGVEHVMCCTELSRGKPCYISTWNRGRLYLRTKDAPDWGVRFGEWFAIPKLPLTSAVRASAAFPGIPPRRLLVHRDGEPASMAFGGTVPEPAKPPIKWTLYLSDGGVWGNLGTQALLEEQLFRGDTKTHGAPPILLVVNASAGVQPTATWQFAVPGWAELKALLRVAVIQNENTVQPRVMSLLESLRQHVVEDRPGRASDPKVIPIALSDNPKKLFPITRQGLWRLGSGDVLVSWALRLADTVSGSLWRGEGGDALLAKLRDIDAARPADERDPDALSKACERLERSRQWDHLCDLAQAGEPLATTLDRVPKASAKALIAQGYALAVSALYIFGVTGDMLPERILTRERLDGLVG